MSIHSITADDHVQLQPIQGSGVYSRHSVSQSSTTDLPTLTRNTCHECHDSADSTVVHTRDFKTTQVFGGWKLLWLIYQSIGAIYGDIGTSPLYVYSSTFDADPNYDDLVGILSLVIWSLIIMVSVKYCLIVLWADDEGEGGTFALFSLLSRHANIAQRAPRELQLTKIERAPINRLRTSSRWVRNLMEGSSIMQCLLKALGIFGVSLVVSDGILMPAQSVMEVIQGIAIVKENISNDAILGISCVIVALLFFSQRYGTSRLANAFAPIVILWLLLNAVYGIYNLITYDHTVLKAFSPHVAGQYLMRTKTAGWKSLNGVILAFTGCEALYADMGSFTRRAIQIAWFVFVFPCLLLAYSGQAAYISVHPEAWGNPFFETIPSGLFWPSFVLAILAAIVASQALITAVFQLLSHMMALSHFPQTKKVHTSKIFYGQLYIPIVNWLLMAGSIIVMIMYHNSPSLGNAYGVCMIITSSISTLLVALVALVVWDVWWGIVLVVWLVFFSIDGTFSSSALSNVPDGSWATLVIAVILSALCLLWRFGKEQQWRAEEVDRFPPSQVLAADGVDNKQIRGLRLTPAFGGRAITRIEGVGLFFDKAGTSATTPNVFIRFLQKFHAAPEIIIFFHLRPLQQPTIPPDERYNITRCFISLSDQDGSQVPMPNCYRVSIKHGYTDQVMTDDLGLLIYEQIRDFIIRGESGERVVSCQLHTHATFDKDDHVFEKAMRLVQPSCAHVALAENLAELQNAYREQVVYVVGNDQMRVGRSASLIRKSLLWLFLWIRENSISKVQALDIAVDKMVEIGFVREI